MARYKRSTFKIYLVFVESKPPFFFVSMTKHDSSMFDSCENVTFLNACLKMSHFLENDQVAKRWTLLTLDLEVPGSNSAWGGVQLMNAHLFAPPPPLPRLAPSLFVLIWLTLCGKKRKD